MHLTEAETLGPQIDALLAEMAAMSGELPAFGGGGSVGADPTKLCAALLAEMGCTWDDTQDHVSEFSGLAIQGLAAAPSTEDMGEEMEVFVTEEAQLEEADEEMVTVAEPAPQLADLVADAVRDADADQEAPALAASSAARPTLPEESNAVAAVDVDSEQEPAANRVLLLLIYVVGLVGGAIVLESAFGEGRLLRIVYNLLSGH